MSERKDGGPAFPAVQPPYQRGAHFLGMTLRDWFAGQAFPVILNDDSEIFRAMAAKEGMKPLEMVAAIAYRVADAMLAERDK